MNRRVQSAKPNSMTGKNSAIIPLTEL